MILAKKVKRGEVLLMEGFLTFDPFSFLTSTTSFCAVFFGLCLDHRDRLCIISIIISIVEYYFLWLGFVEKLLFGRVFSKFRPLITETNVRDGTAETFRFFF